MPAILPASVGVCPDPFNLWLSTSFFTPPYTSFLALVAADTLNSLYSPF
jgi:hypothetical protein